MNKNILENVTTCVSESYRNPVDLRVIEKALAELDTEYVEFVLIPRERPDIKNQIDARKLDVGIGAFDNFFKVLEWLPKWTNQILCIKNTSELAPMLRRMLDPRSVLYGQDVSTNLYMVNNESKRIMGR